MVDVNARVPAFVKARVSRNGTPAIVTVVPDGIENVPLPPMVPPLHVIAGEVTARFAVPLSVPPVIVRTGIDCVEALLIESVPPLTVSDDVIVPAMLFVPAPLFSVPAPLMVVDASNAAAVV